MWIFSQMIVASGGTQPMQVFVQTNVESGLGSHRTKLLPGTVLALARHPHIELEEEPLEAYQAEAKLLEDSGHGKYLCNELLANDIFVLLHRPIKRVVILELQYVWKHESSHIYTLTKQEPICSLSVQGTVTRSKPTTPSDSKPPGGSDPNSSDDDDCLARRFSKSGRKAEAQKEHNVKESTSRTADSTETRQSTGSFRKTLKIPNVQQCVTLPDTGKLTCNQQVEQFFDLQPGALTETFGIGDLDDSDADAADDSEGEDSGQDDNVPDDLKGDDKAHEEGGEMPECGGADHAAIAGKEDKAKDDLEDVADIDELLSRLGLEMITWESAAVDADVNKVTYTIGKDGDIIGSINLLPKKNGARSMKASCRMQHSSPGLTPCACWATLRDDSGIIGVHLAMVRWLGQGWTSIYKKVISNNYPVTY